MFENGHLIFRTGHFQRTIQRLQEKYSVPVKRFRPQTSLASSVLHVLQVRLELFAMTSLKFTLRQLRKSPGFTLTAILTLALGIGAATSIFSVVNAVLLKPFAFRDPGRLVVMREVVGEWKYPTIAFSYLHYLRLKRDSKTLEDAAIFDEVGASVSSEGDHPHIVGAIPASANLLSLLGVSPAIGRDFRPEEATEGHTGVAILTWEGWQSLLNGVPNPLGKTLRIGGTPSTVIGVLPKGFQFPAIAEMSGFPSAFHQTGPVKVIYPYAPGKDDLAARDDGGFGYYVVARLKPGVTLEQARSELDMLQKARTRALHGSIHLGISVQPFAKDVTSDYSGSIWLLFAAIGGVLLIACANLANLQLARAVAMERESAVRAALGANRLQLLWSRMLESLVLAAIGGIAGIALAFLGVKALVALAPANVPRLNEVQVSLPVLLFAAGVSMLTALLFGILPALRSLRVDPQAVLQASSTRAANSKQSNATRNLLVAAEVACTVTLLIVTGLVLRSFSNLLHQNRGFDSDHVAMAQVDLSSSQYGVKETRAAFIDRTLRSLEALPGVQSVGMTSYLPLTGANRAAFLARPDHPLPIEQQTIVNVRWVSPGYLPAMRIPLIAGRNITEADRSGDVMPALISEAAARAAFPGENPIGRKMVAFGGWETYTIVGVVADARVNGLRDAVAMAYAPYWEYSPSTVSFLVRGSQASETLIPEMRKAIWGVDPQAAIPVLKSLDAQVSESVATDRFQTILLSGFGVAALLLALLGVHGVLAYSVSLRQQEFGIRIALGSDKARLMLLVLRQAAWPVVSGSVVGLVLAFVVTRWLRSLLYEARAVDPLAILGSLFLLGIAAVLAAILPARRAAGVDPVEVLRAQ
jgi:predicted permease